MESHLQRVRKHQWGRRHRARQRECRVLARHVDAIGDDAAQTEGELLELDGLLGAKEHARVDRGPAAQPLQGKRQEPHTCGGGDEVPVAREVIPNTARMGLHVANGGRNDANTAAR